MTWSITERGEDWSADQTEGHANLSPVSSSFMDTPLDRLRPAPERRRSDITPRYVATAALLFTALYATAWMIGRFWPFGG